VFENRVLKTYCLKRDEVTLALRNRHNEIHNLYSTKYNQNDQVKEDEMGRACNTNVDKKNAYGLLV
jgi:hypothetical protein